MAAFNFLKEFNQRFETSCGTTPQWASFYRKSVNWFKKNLADAVDNIQMSRGHFYFSGFFTSKKTGQIYYFSISDVRYFNTVPRMMIRTAESYKDYTGGRNRWVVIDENFAENIKRAIQPMFQEI